MLTPWLLFPPNFLLLNRSIALTYTVPSLLLSHFPPDLLIALPLNYEKILAIPNIYTPDQSSITLVFCCWLLIYLYHLPQIYCSHQPGPWSADVATDLLLSNLLLNLETFPFTYTPQLIGLWSILNHPVILMLIINWFVSLTPDISLPPTRSLVFCCRHWYSTIKSSSGYRKKIFPLTLHNW